MKIAREWMVCCTCPDCFVYMPDLAFIQEQHYEEAESMPEMWTMIGGFTCGASPRTCPNCQKTFETCGLTPQMIAVEPGTRTPLARRKEADSNDRR